MEIDNMWEKIKKGLKDGATLSMEKIEEYTKIGKLKIEELAAKRKIERNYSDIGERVYELVEDGRGSDIAGYIAVQKSVNDIKELKEELTSITDKIQAVMEEAKAAKEQPDDDDEVQGI